MFGYLFSVNGEVGLSLSWQRVGEMLGVSAVLADLPECSKLTVVHFAQGAGARLHRGGVTSYVVHL